MIARHISHLHVSWSLPGIGCMQLHHPFVCASDKPFQGSDAFEHVLAPAAFGCGTGVHLGPICLLCRRRQVQIMHHIIRLTIFCQRLKLQRTVIETPTQNWGFALLLHTAQHTKNQALNASILPYPFGSRLLTILCSLFLRVRSGMTLGVALFPVAQARLPRNRPADLGCPLSSSSNEFIGFKIVFMNALVLRK